LKATKSFISYAAKFQAKGHYIDGLDDVLNSARKIVGKLSAPGRKRDERKALITLRLRAAFKDLTGKEARRQGDFDEFRRDALALFDR
jgi:hypothetical protein